MPYQELKWGYPPRKTQTSFLLLIAVMLGILSGCRAEITSYENPSPTTTSQGILYTFPQREAIRAAQKYVDNGGVSRIYLQNWLINQDRFKPEDAKFAVAHIQVDWDKQAVIAAKQQMELNGGMTRSGLIDQLHSGSFFTVEQSEYAADQIGLK